MMMVEGVKEWAQISQQLKQLFHMKLKLNSNVLLVNPYTLPFWKPRRFVTCSSAAPSRNRHPKSSSSTSDREAVRSIRLSKVQELRSKGCEPYAYKWDRSHSTRELQSMYEQLPSAEEASDFVSVAGRIISRRAFGKLAFFTLRDDSATIQIFFLALTLNYNLLQKK